MEKIIADSQAELKAEDAMRLRKGDLEEDIDRDSPWVKETGLGTALWLPGLCSSIHDAATVGTRKAVITEIEGPGKQTSKRSVNDSITRSTWAEL
ncbi:hypothetical protein GCM10020331_091560 [Ectobacillus funiculus]